MSDEPLTGGPAARSGLDATTAAWHANSHAVLVPPPTPEVPACVKVAGAVCGLWVNPDGEVQVTIDLTNAESWLRAGDGTIALRLLTPEGQTLFDARVTPPAAEGTGTGYATVHPLRPRRHFEG